MHETVDAFDEEAFDEFPVKVMTSSSLSYFLSTGTHMWKKSGITIAQYWVRFRDFVRTHTKKSKENVVMYLFEEIMSPML